MILVTGATGLLGSHLLIQLTEQGETCRALYRNKAKIDDVHRLFHFYFQEKAQEHTGTTPSYKTIEETGPDHDKQFRVGVFIGGEQIATGVGKSKQDAEQQAARNGL